MKCCVDLSKNAKVDAFICPPISNGTTVAAPNISVCEFVIRHVIAIARHSNSVQAAMTLPAEP